MDAAVTIPETVDVTVDDRTITVNGENGSVTRSFDHPMITITEHSDEIRFATESTRKEHTAVINTYKTLLENMVHGVETPFQYTLKAVYAHFPMQVSMKGDTFTVENFLGERAPRTLDIPDTVTVSVDGDTIHVTGADKEIVGDTAAQIEQLCYMNKKDQRTFQDGIYLVDKNVSGDTA